MHWQSGKASHVRLAAALLAAAAMALWLRPAAQAAARQVATGESVVWQGQARFTVISDNLIRLEWSAEGAFTDRPTAIVARPQAKGRATLDGEGTTMTLATKELTVTYTPDGKPFSADNLRITWRNGGEVKQWVPGQPDAGNLGGTRHSLDGIHEDGLPRLPPGLLSREGYFFHDDSGSPVWRADGTWIEPRGPGVRRDWYFCVYRHEYPVGLREWVNLTGKIPMLPRWAFGSWYSRYWPYTDREERDIIRRFRAEDIPLDVLVIDVDWHLHGWESYDWNPDLFPNPREFLTWVHKQGCKVTLNNHPGALPAADSHYDEMLRSMGLTRADHPDGIRINVADQRHAAAYMDVLHNPMIDDGIDFWWIDGNCAHMPGLDSQMWTSKVYYDGTEAYTKKRALIFARYGGFGSHRYPTGFSGDTYSHWGVLNFEIMFTAVAGNVAYPYWSHDVGGFMGKNIDPELYIRWVQFGALSPILRLHSNHGVREPWNYGTEALEISRKYFQLRYRLVPYFYSYSRLVHDTGMPLVRPLYLDYPELEEAYQYQYQYLLGGELLVAPIGTPGEGGVTRKEIFLPPGEWYDYETGEAYRGPAVFTYAAPLDRCPIFVRAGAVIPMQPDMDYIGQKPIDPLTLDIYPGADGEFRLYEDDGESLDYRDGEFSHTRIEFDENRAANRQTVRIGSTKGRYDGQAERRTYLVRINRRLAPTSVSLNGRAMRRRVTRHSLDKADRGWHYDRRNTRLEIKVPTSIRRPVRLTIAGGAGREVFDLAQRARRYEERAAGALAAARRHNLPKSEAALERLRDRARACAASLARAQAVAAQQRREVARLANEAVASARTIGQEAADPGVRADLLAALVGLDIAAWIEPGRDPSLASLGARVSLALTAPGTSATLAATPPEGWSGVDPTSVTTPVDAHTATLSVPLRRVVQRLPGMLTFKGSVTVNWRGQAIERPVVVMVDNSYLQWFHLIGPFDNTENKGFDTVYPPEENIDFTLSYPGKDGQAKWQTTDWVFPQTRDQLGPIFIDLIPRFDPHEDVAAHAVTYLWSPQAKDVLFLLGSDDGSALWLNGEKIFSHPGQRIAVPADDRIPARLREGWNTVLMKIVQIPGDWGFYLQVVDRNGRPLPDVFSALNLEM